MKDNYGRTIDYLRISVTDLCNYRCVYCMAPDGVEKHRHSEVLRFEEIVEIAEAAAACGVRKLRLTGGEPLVRRGIVSLCRSLREIAGIEELTLTTNGSLLPALAQPLREAGVDRLNISLDTLDPAKFSQISRCGSLENVLSGLAAAEQAGFSNTKLDCVLLGGVNTDEIPALAQLSMDKPYSVRFIELMPMGVCASMPPERFVSADAVLEALPELEPVGTDGVAETYRLPGAAGTVGVIRALSHSFCAGCNRLRLTSDGRLKPCLHSDAEFSLRGLHGEALRQAVLDAAAAKPPRHFLLEQGRSGTRRGMYEIGG